MGATLACSGLRVEKEADDVVHPDEIYVAKACAEVFGTRATPAIATMAATAAAIVLGNTQTTGTDLAASFTARDVTLDVAAGTFTIVNSGLYRLYWSMELTGEEDEPVTFEWQKNGTNLGEPTERTVLLDATLSHAIAGRVVSHECKQSFVKGDIVALNVLGSNSEVITMTAPIFGIEQVGSLNYGP